MAAGEPLAQPAIIPTFREALIGQITRLNPILTTPESVEHDITSMVFEGLTRINAYGEPVPALAQNWLISSDGLEYIVRLRTDVLWQDGLPFSAADVIYTVGLLQSPDFPGDPALGAFWRTVEVQLLDTDLIRFRLTQSLGRFLDMLQIGILPEHALRGTTAGQIAAHPFNLSPIGTGPYQLEAIESSDSSSITGVSLRVAPTFRQRPEGQSGYTVERLRFQVYGSFDAALSALQSGQVDGLAGRNTKETQALLAQQGINLHTAIRPIVGVVIFNWASDNTRFFREQRVRVALQTGLDRSPIIIRHLSGLAVTANSPLAPGSWAYLHDLSWPTPDIAAARTLLEAALTPRPGGDATPPPTGPLSFTLLTPDDPALVGVAQEIAAQWSQMNVNAIVAPANATDYQARLESGDFGAALVELSLEGSADPDIYQFWDADQYPDGKNYGGIDDRRTAEELERARREPSGINRIMRYHEFQRDFVARAIALPLYYPLYVYATSRAVGSVQLGYVAVPSSRFLNIRDWTVMAG
jgi:peptide/nickel transport system substrate-binding protein